MRIIFKRSHGTVPNFCVLYMFFVEGNHQSEPTSKQNRFKKDCSCFMIDSFGLVIYYLEKSLTSFL